MCIKVKFFPQNVRMQVLILVFWVVPTKIAKFKIMSLRYKQLAIMPFFIFHINFIYSEFISIFAVTLRGNVGQSFRGFLIQGRQRADDTSVVGSFSQINAATTRFSSCSTPEV